MTENVYLLNFDKSSLNFVDISLDFISFLSRENEFKDLYSYLILYWSLCTYVEFVPTPTDKT